MVASLIHSDALGETCRNFPVNDFVQFADFLAVWQSPIKRHAISFHIIRLIYLKAIERRMMLIENCRYDQ